MGLGPGSKNIALPFEILPLSTQNLYSEPRELPDELSIGTAIISIYLSSALARLEPLTFKLAILTSVFLVPLAIMLLTGFYF